MQHFIVKNVFSGAKNLEAKKEWINELNVFPVPDGDTGTNMSMTIISAAKEVAAVEKPVMKDLAKAISSGSLQRGKRKLRCYSFPAAPWVYKDDQAL